MDATVAVPWLYAQGKCLADSNPRSCREAVASHLFTHTLSRIFSYPAEGASRAKLPDDGEAAEVESKVCAILPVGDDRGEPVGGGRGRVERR